MSLAPDPRDFRRMRRRRRAVPVRGSTRLPDPEAGLRDFPDSRDIDDTPRLAPRPRPRPRPKPMPMPRDFSTPPRVPPPDDRPTPRPKPAPREEITPDPIKINTRSKKRRTNKPSGADARNRSKSKAVNVSALRKSQANQARKRNAKTVNVSQLRKSQANQARARNQARPTRRRATPRKRT